jgi:hypothetical protein
MKELSAANVLLKFSEEAYIGSLAATECNRISALRLGLGSSYGFCAEPGLFALLFGAKIAGSSYRGNFC